MQNPEGFTYEIGIKRRRYTVNTHSTEGGNKMLKTWETR